MMQAATDIFAGQRQEGATTRRIRFAINRLLAGEDHQLVYLWPVPRSADYPLRIAITILQQNPSREFFQVDMKLGRIYLPNGRLFRVIDACRHTNDAAGFYNATVLFDHACFERGEFTPAPCWWPYAKVAEELAGRE
jgi:hypothetical protein